MKYVMFAKATPTLTHHIPFIFPANMVHDEVARAVSPLLEGYLVVSAGEWNGFLASGRSETLNLSARDEDSWIISTYDYTGGMA